MYIVYHILKYCHLPLYKLSRCKYISDIRFFTNLEIRVPIIVLNISKNVFTNLEIRVPENSGTNLEIRVPENSGTVLPVVYGVVLLSAILIGSLQNYRKVLLFRYRSILRLVAELGI